MFVERCFRDALDAAAGGDRDARFDYVSKVLGVPPTEARLHVVEEP